MISDATQIAALRTAEKLADGAVKLSASERLLFKQHIDAIRQRIIAAARRSPLPHTKETRRGGE
jgi:hypothetical protein